MLRNAACAFYDLRTKNPHCREAAMWFYISIYLPSQMKCFKTALTFTGPVIFVAIYRTNLSDGIVRPHYSWTFNHGNV